ncbi:Protein of unknown function [Bacillus cereus]|uniref:Uncharacterized protein n=1 Tax=Bacillus wiedmannii TaxID=1890302 RepID=A0AB37YU34_9BACI|nr:Protein of unknown function [Bacillus cereus]SCC46940.1 Protein of unknown function [Bacillus wiedmannii]
MIKQLAGSYSEPAIILILI